MRVGGCLLQIIIVAWSFQFVIGDSPTLVNRKKRHLFPLIGFLQGYKMGQNLALQLPPFVLSPVVVLPSINQEQSINIQTNEINEEAFKQDDFPEKLIKPFCNTTGNLDSAVNDPDNVREIHNSTELAESEDANLDKDMFRQNTITSNNPVTESNINDKESTTITSGDIIATSAKIDGTQTTSPPGFYPTALYKNDKIATLTITEAPIDNDVMLPSTDNNWQKFSKDANTTADIQVESRTVWNNDVSVPSQGAYQIPKPYYYSDPIKHSNLYYGRPYYHASKRDPWNNYYYSERNHLTSEFRPVAGLYYDGYLEKSPVKNSGFVPYNHNYFY